MPSSVEKAKTSRSKCRGCKQVIEKETLRIAVAVPNAFGSGESLQYFHPSCAAERRSEAMKNVLEEFSEQFSEESLPQLRRLVETGLEHPRWTRVSGAGIDPSGRARCRQCREAIAKGSVRLELEFTEEGMVNAAGFLHPSCAAEYLGSTLGLLERLERAGVPAEVRASIPG